ncbi:MAG: hypothetical protein L0K86_04490 [Actinomycetia bacterium]|nr:hypothetical protein [Actinomycetes bacterium]
MTINGTNDDDTIVGTAGRDVIRTWKGDDVIKGRGGNDVICGDRGADTLIGGRGRDRLHGGPFRLIDYGEGYGAKGDRLIGGHGNDRLFGGGSPENEIGWVNPEWVVPDRVEFPAARGGVTITKRGVATGPGIGRDRLFGIQRITGTKWADDITVRGEHMLAGMGGPDRITVLAGTRDPQTYPKVVGQHGADRIDLSRYTKGLYELYGGTGRDRITGSKRSEYISDQFGRGVVRGGGAYDQINVTSRMTVRGEGGDDLLQVTLVNGRLRSIDGGPGRDRLALTNRRRDRLTIDVRAKRLEAGNAATSLRSAEKFNLPAMKVNARFIGSDKRERVMTRVGKGHVVRVKLRGGNDRFNAGGPSSARRVGRTVVDGGRGADELSGGASRDAFRGGRGNDRLWGDAARDALRGGPGRDKADGGPGEHDLCRAESKSRCER